MVSSGTPVAATADEDGMLGRRALLITAERRH